MAKIKVILVDDHKIFRDGLKMNLMDYYEDIEIIGEAGTREELFNNLTKETPDIILMDFQLLDTTGIDIAKELKINDKFDKIKLIILSAHHCYNLKAPNYELIIEAIDAGIDGFLLKDSSVNEIVTALFHVREGERFFIGETINIEEINKILIQDRKRLVLFLNKFKNFGLSDREIEIIKFLSTGLSAKEISTAMNISEDGVNSHKDNIKNKLQEKHGLNLRNNVELVVWAIKNKIIQI
jgi:two-component system, NarL family, response regulator DegU